MTYQTTKDQLSSAMRAIQALEEIGCQFVSVTCSVHYTRPQIQIADGQPLCDWISQIGHAPKLPYRKNSNWLHARAVFHGCDVAWLVLKNDSAIV